PVLIDGSPPPSSATEPGLLEPPVPPVVCRLVNKAGSYLRPDGVLGDLGSEAPDDGRFDSGGERFFASGTALVARASTFRTLGGLAEPLFAYYEDGDWSWRARLAGLRVVYDPSSVVTHRQSATSGGAVHSWVRVLARRNKVLVLVRNAPGQVFGDLLRQDLRCGPQEGARRATLAKLPWALSSRRRLSRKWKLSPEEVWSAWAGVDNSWDTGPYRQA
ncbi:MAG: glycosyltransferase family 2 protein, partial [Acidimicrobiales bacterium]